MIVGPFQMWSEGVHENHYASRGGPHSINDPTIKMKGEKMCTSK